MIDLDRFDKPKVGVAPVIDRQGIYEGRKFFLNMPDAWYRLQFAENVKVLEDAYAMQVQGRPEINGYVFGNEFIPQSFNVMRRKFWRDGLSFEYRLGIPRAWTGGTFLMWEDKQWYYKKNWMRVPPELMYIKLAFDNKSNIRDIKHVTAELRYVFFVYSLERSANEDFEMLKKWKLGRVAQEKLQMELRKSLEFRVIDSIKETGGEFISIVRHGGQRANVQWQISGQKFNTLINTDSLQVLEAGLCVSGEDSKFNMKSLVLTVGDFHDKGEHFVAYDDDEERDW